MGICSVLFYISVLFFSHQQSEIVRVSGEKPAPDTRFEHVHSPTCQSTLPPGIGRDFAVPLIPSRGPCSPIPRDRDPSRGYSIGDSVASRNPWKKPSRGRGGDPGGVNIQGDRYQYRYLVPVSIGNPRQTLNLIMDTGSDVTWTQCMPCITGDDCNYYHQQNPYFNTTDSSTFSQLCPKHPYFNTTNSPTFSQLCPELHSSKCFYTIPYLDDSRSCGYNALDTLFVGKSHQFPNYTFGCGQNSHGDFSEANGILGLAMNGNNTFLSQTAQTFGKTFCFCIPPTNSSLGYLLLGDGARRHCKVEASTPLIGITDYDVHLHGITFNHETIHLANSDPSSTSRTTLIDSGTTVTRLPRQVYNALRSKFQEYMSKYPKAPSQDKILRTCYYSKHYEQVAPPNIVLHFDQADVPLDRAGLVLSAENDSVVCFAFYKRKQTDNVSIIGSTQLRNLNVLFDVNAGKVGFGRGSCGS